MFWYFQCKTERIAINNDVKRCAFDYDFISSVKILHLPEQQSIAGYFALGVFFHKEMQLIYDECHVRHKLTKIHYTRIDYLQ